MKSLPDFSSSLVLTGDCLELLSEFPDNSVDMVLTSPPYENCRTYGIDFALAGEEWVAWMVKVTKELSRVCHGLIAIVVAGKTEDYRWSASPMLLAADLHRAGFNLRNPLIYGRYGIPGSGGPDWLRGDTEFVICVTRPGQLPWSDNTACGHAPKFGPGGEMSHRLSNGERRNQWGGNDNGDGHRRKNGERQYKKRPSHKILTTSAKRGHPRTPDGKREIQQYEPPVLANPGNLIWIGAAGGGRMGDALCHENEAPFAEKLCEFIILSLCPPNGIVLDPFCGSGTSLAVAKQWRRRAIGIDIRYEQVVLSSKRLANVTPVLEGFA